MVLSEQTSLIKMIFQLKSEVGKEVKQSCEKRCIPGRKNYNCKFEVKSILACLRDKKVANVAGTE